MSSKSQPCNSCRWRKVKCIKTEGESRCAECTKRDEECERRQGSPVANSTPCEECKKAHVACDWPGAGACARCRQFRLECTHCASAAASTSLAPGMPPAHPTDGAPPPSGSSNASKSPSKFFAVVLNN